MDLHEAWFDNRTYNQCFEDDLDKAEWLAKELERPVEIHCANEWIYHNNAYEAAKAMLNGTPVRIDHNGHISATTHVAKLLQSIVMEATYQKLRKPHPNWTRGDYLYWTIWWNHYHQVS